MDQELASSFDPKWIEWPRPDENVREALLRAYEDGSWGRYHGPNVHKLEAELARFHGVKHAMVCASGTIAVQIALRALHLPEGAEVILAGYDFPGNFRSIQDANLFPVLVDIDPRTWCLNADRIEEAISGKTAAIVVSHLHGGLANMGRIREIGEEHGIAVLEDACQATGATLEGKRAGSLGDVGVLSFGGSKLLTAGRGGAILTDRDKVLQRAKVFCERGNHAFPLSELQAAVLLPQLARVNETNRLRLQNVRKLRELLADVRAQLMPIELNMSGEPTFYKHAWLCESAEMAKSIVGRAVGWGVPIGAGFRGFAKRPASQARRVGSLAEAKTAAERTILLHHPILGSDETATVWIARWIRQAISD